MSGAWRGPEVEGVLLRWQTDRGYKLTELNDDALELRHRGRLVQLYAQTADLERVHGDATDDFMDQVGRMLMALGDDDKVEWP